MDNLKETALELEDRIKQGAEIKMQSEKLRKYVGMSEIGGSCPRALQYKKRTMKKRKVPYKLAAAFDVGRHLEPMILDWIKHAGYEVVGCQKKLSDLGGSFSGHPDGILKEAIQTENGLLDAVLEIKTAKTKSFNEIKKEGIQKISRYIAQAQCYMHYLELNHTLFVVFNKDTSELYCEFVEYETHIFKWCRETAEAVIKSEETLARPADFECNKAPCVWCEFRNQCWGLIDPF